ncbi:hypothetical protein ACFU8I_25370, partial [Streptomyces sp. NPDC057540]
MSNSSGPALSTGRSLVYLIVAGIAWGTAGAAASLIFRVSDMGPLALSFWRCVGGLVLLLGALALRSRRTAAHTGSNEGGSPGGAGRGGRGARPPLARHKRAVERKLAEARRVLA